MDKTEYSIAKSKFFGCDPDENVLLKHEAKVFYGFDSNSAVKPDSQSRINNNDNFQENVNTNVLRKRRSSIGNAGHKISKFLFYLYSILICKT